MTPAPRTLIIGYGNPGRGDDGLGPEFVRRIAQAARPRADMIVDFQLKVEHALDVASAARVVFVDASVACPPPFRLEPLAPAAKGEVGSHALSPGAVLALAQLTCGRAPEAYLLAIRGEAFGMMQDGLSPDAERNLRAAERFLRDWLEEPPGSDTTARAV